MTRLLRKLGIGVALAASSLSLTPGCASASTTYPQQYISGYSPTTGPAGTIVTISGSGFTGSNAGWVGSAHDAAVTVISDTQAKLTIPTDAAVGAESIAILNPQHASFSPVLFSVTAAQANKPGAFDLSATSYSVAQSAGVATIPVHRTGGSSGAVSVHFATSQGTAVSGRDFTSKSGTLNWANGDTSVRNVSIAILTATPFSGSRSFSFALSSATGGATLASPTSATVTINGSSTTTPGAVALSGSSYSVSQSAGKLTVTVDRSGGSSGAASVHYATSNGSAISGTDYTAASGTLSWASGDTAAKTFSVTVSTAKAFSGSKTFNVALSSVSGASLGSPTSAGVTINGSGSSGGTPSVHVEGNHLVDGTGKVIQLRGVNASGLEGYAAEGWTPGNPWGFDEPVWPNLKSWDVNVVRIPLNEASWLGYTCTDSTGASRNPDPGANYKQTVDQTIADAQAQGFLVVLDLHWSSPNAMINGKLVPVCPLTQQAMADADHSVDFWTSIATRYKGNPGVMFELFNEPFFYWLTSGEDQWNVLENGGTLTEYTTEGAYGNYSWKTAGMQQMLDAVRATGATNVVLVGGVNWNGDLSEMSTHVPSDSQHQLAIAWHAYPNTANGLPTQPAYGTSQYTYAQQLATQYPLVVTETGDHNATGTVGSPFDSNVLPWADTNGISYIPWCWDAWNVPDNVLIKDSSGTPTDGYGVYVKQHMLCRGGGGANCQ